MIVVAPLIAALLASPVSRAPRVGEGARLELGTRLFNSGDFEAALKALDAAALEGGEAQTLERVHLLRAQCFAARQDFSRAEEAFALALDANPEASLDPGRVDPTVVRMLESVRARLTGTLVVNATPAGAQVTVDGQARGAAPATLTLGVGRHRVELRWGEGEATSADVHVRPRREVRMEWVQGAPKLVAAQESPEARPMGPIGDFRFAPEFPTTQTVDPTLPLELAGGLELGFYRVTLAARLYPSFGLTPRFTFALPVLDMLGVLIEAGVPFQYERAAQLGISGGAGIEVFPVRWFGGFLMLGARHYFIKPGNDGTALTVTLGIRLRRP